jgi:hypothetical protein
MRREVSITSRFSKEKCRGKLSSVKSEQKL